MHALGRYIQELMDARGWKQADLVRASGLSRALVSRLVTKDTLGRMVEDSTIAGLARAFPEVGEEAFITKSAEALGVPVDRLIVVDASMERISNRALLDLLAQRLGESTSERGGTNDKPSAAPKKSNDSPGAGEITRLRGRNVGPDSQDDQHTEDMLEDQDDYAAGRTLDPNTDFDD